MNLAQTFFETAVAEFPEIGPRGLDVLTRLSVTTDGECLWEIEKDLEQAQMVIVNVYDLLYRDIRRNKQTQRMMCLAFVLLLGGDVPRFIRKSP